MARNTFLDLLSRALIGLGVLLLAVFAYSFATADSGPRLAIPEKDLTLTDLTPGAPVAVSFVLHNSGRLPMRAVGLAEC